MTRRRAPIVVAIMVLFGIFAGGGPAHADDGSNPRFPECAQPGPRGTGGVQILMLIDISKSLQTTDPAGARARFVSDWLNAMVGLARRGIDVRVEVAGYGTRFLPLRRWQKVDPSSAGGLLSVAGELPNNDRDTDHALGLLNASAELDKESARVEGAGRQPCRMLVWFTDGIYDFGNSQKYRREIGAPPTTPYSPLPVTPANEPAIKAAGLKLMCGDNGPVMDMRRQNTDIIAIALNLNLDFKLVEELSAGTGYTDEPDAPCHLPPYQGGTFERLSPDSPQGGPGGAEKCSDQLGCVVKFAVDVPKLTDVAQFDFGVKDPSKLRSVELTTPSGAMLTAPSLSPGASSLDGGGFSADVVVTSASRGSVVVQRGAKPLDGKWTVAVGGSTADSGQRFTPEFRSLISGQLAKPTRFVAGKGGELEIGLRDGAGKPLKAATSGRLDLAVKTEDGKALSVKRQNGKFVVAVPAAATTTDDDSIALTAQVDDDTDLQFQANRLLIPVDQPGFPKVTFPDAKGGVVRPSIFDTPGSVRIPYVVVGPAEGKGCVTATNKRWPGDDGIEAKALYSGNAKTCVSAGEQVKRTVTVKVTNRIEKRSCQALTFDLTGTSADKTRTFDQTICLRVERGPTIWTQLLGVLLALLGLVPLIALGVYNRINGRLPDGIFLARRTVQVVGTDLVVPGGAPLLSRGDFKEVAPSDPHTLAISKDELTLESRALTVPRAHGRGRFSPTMLFTGPRTYLRQTGEAPIVVGSGDNRLHRGVLGEPLLVPRNVHDLWVITAAEPAIVFAVRILGQSSELYRLSGSIRSISGSDLPDLLAPDGEGAEDSSDL